MIFFLKDTAVLLLTDLTSLVLTGSFGLLESE